MRPFRVFSVLFTVAVLLLLFILLVPSGRLQITQDLTLRFISVEQLKGEGEPDYADIGHILAAHSQELEETTGLPQSSEKGPGGEEPPSKTEMTRPRPSRVEGKGADEIAQILRTIENAQSLEPFFRALVEESGQEVVRVVHYGDSQIEGDRISDYLRQRLQERFGGCGVGLIPIYDPMPVRISVEQEAEGDWHYYVPFGRLDESIPHDRFGIMGAIYRYQPYPQPAPAETGSEDSHPVQQEPAPVEAQMPPEELRASVTVRRSKLALPTAQRFEEVRLLTGDVEQPVPILWEAGQEMQRGRLEPARSPRIYRPDLEPPLEEFTLHFLSGPSPDLYGMALDCPQGVAVDNVPLRGSSGIFVHRWSRESIASQMNSLNVRLIIWQFGVNVVPYLEDNYEFYRRNLETSLTLLRQAYPKAAVLVIGISDMSQKDEAGYYRTRSNVEGIRDAQRSAALASGCAFWDLHEAMGGRNSMPSWVKAELATSDYTHFNPRGARIVARMLYNALLAGQKEVLPEDEPHEEEIAAPQKSRSAE
ncbi:MAG TPA: GDSL-type esterase/lipase family protein [Acidobacteriota bacterium]|nr:GDSL-type esterase/lipase family protein [Acidobacteriota bacterium]